jgi:flagellar biosynthesis/type III secretory pathway protein FliH
MALIKIPFNTSLANVSAPRGRVTTARISAPAAPADPPADDFSEERQTLAALGRQLLEVQRTVQSQTEQVQQLVTKVAAAIAAEALGGDDELLDRRVVHYADLLMQQLEPKQSATAFVHPKCVETLTRWADETTRQQLEIRPDGNLAAGDCRIEVGGKGLVASLESFLAAAAESDVWNAEADR